MVGSFQFADNVISDLLDVRKLAVQLSKLLITKWSFDIVITEKIAAFFVGFSFPQQVSVSQFDSQGNLNWGQLCDIAAIAFVYRHNSKIWASYPYNLGHI